MKKNFQHWARGLISAVIVGASTGFLSALGVSGAQIVGVKVDQLELNQLLVVIGTAGAIRAAQFLSQSPLPPEDSTAENAKST